MWKILIVDDEYIVRQGLRKTLPWEKMEVVIAGEAENAQEAIKVAKTIYPDIVLCDIRLPGGEGFSIIPAIQDIVPWVQFIMLTAYSDKEYMMKAIYNQVCDYLFKPAKKEEIQAAIERAKDKILICQDRIKQDVEHRNFMMENMEALREHTLTNFLNGAYDAFKLSEDKKILNLSLTGPLYRLILIKGGEEQFFDLLQKISVMAPWNPVISRIIGGSDLIALILNCSNGNDIPEYQLHDILAGNEFFVSELLHEISDIPQHYRRMKLKVSQEPVEKILEMEVRNETLRKIRENIYEAVRYHDSLTEVQRLFGKYLAEAQKESLSRLDLQSDFQKIVETIKAMTGIQYRDENRNFSPAEMEEYFAEMCDKIQNIYSNEFSDISGRALYYIKKHFSEDISLEQLAAEMFLSASYLSRSIKERTGRGFQQWLHMYRIEAAKEKLKDPEKSIEDIAYECGYHSYRIFSEHFRKYTGQTASQYRSEQIQSEK